MSIRKILICLLLVSLLLVSVVSCDKIKRITKPILVARPKVDNSVKENDAEPAKASEQSNSIVISEAQPASDAKQGNYNSPKDEVKAASNNYSNAESFFYVYDGEDTSKAKKNSEPVSVKNEKPAQLKEETPSVPEKTEPEKPVDAFVPKSPQQSAIAPVADTEKTTEPEVSTEDLVEDVPEDVKLGSDEVTVNDEFDFLGDNYFAETYSFEPDNKAEEKLSFTASANRPSFGGFSLFGGNSNKNKGFSTKADDVVKDNAKTEVSEIASVENVQATDDYSSDVAIQTIENDYEPFDVAKVTDNTETLPKIDTVEAVGTVKAAETVDIERDEPIISAPFDTVSSAERKKGIQFGLGVLVSRLEADDFTVSGVKFVLPVAFNYPFKDNMTASVYLRPAYFHVMKKESGSKELPDSFLLGAGVGFGITYNKFFELKMNLGAEIFNKGTDIHKDPVTLIDFSILPSAKLGSTNLWVSVPLQASFIFNSQYKSMFSSGVIVTYRSGEVDR